MSWKILNEIIGLASIDQNFCQELLADPLKAVEAHQFSLTDEEKNVLRGIRANDIYEFSQYVYAQLRSDPYEKG